MKEIEKRTIWSLLKRVREQRKGTKKTIKKKK
jgi:hypothetical protein